MATEQVKEPRSTREYLGACSVDSGSIWIGDPCYIMGDDATHRVKDWSKDYVDKALVYDPEHPHTSKEVAAPLGEGVGVAVPNFGGDGGYSVWVTKGRDGLVTKAEIFFYYSVDSVNPETGKYSCTRKQADEIIAMYKAKEAEWAAEREEFRLSRKQSLIDCGMDEEVAHQFYLEDKEREEKE